MLAAGQCWLTTCRSFYLPDPCLLHLNPLPAPPLTPKVIGGIYFDRWARDRWRSWETRALWKWLASPCCSLLITPLPSGPPHAPSSSGLEHIALDQFLVHKPIPAFPTSIERRNGLTSELMVARAAPRRSLLLCVAHPFECDFFWQRITSIDMLPELTPQSGLFEKNSC